jgi:excisionase family DNA binding protein
MSEQFLSTRQAAAIAGKHQRTIVAWIHKGELAAFKFPGMRGPYLIKEGDLVTLLAEKYTPLPYSPESHDAQEQ